ncbi:hypothetical protein [Streptomyces sp. AV19]|uniref:hypothetical protein n=1 Tax=Streptomyces sp. AV19 TaxID=2793068 RepID=UPI001F3061DC|nr:hypothetical protein [Streptomyces sp. AV19]MDG4536499.1 hypothetical protein [Streptomyces sp. AV19]
MADPLEGGAGFVRLTEDDLVVVDHVRRQMARQVLDPALIHGTKETLDDPLATHDHSPSLTT